MEETNDHRWDRFWNLHEQLDTLVSEEYRQTRTLDPKKVPANAKQAAVWNQLTDPEFLDILEWIDTKNSPISEGSRIIWKKALAECQAKIKNFATTH